MYQTLLLGPFWPVGGWFTFWVLNKRLLFTDDSAFSWKKTISFPFKFRWNLFIEAYMHPHAPLTVKMSGWLCITLYICIPQDPSTQTWFGINVCCDLWDNAFVKHLKLQMNAYTTITIFGYIYSTAICFEMCFATLRNVPKISFRAVVNSLIVYPW